MTDRYMVYIKTLGLEPGAAIISIGACRFRPGDGVIGETFYVEIDTASCCEFGLKIDQDTLDWWRDQDSDLAPLSGDVRLPDAMARFKHYVDGADEIWANSPKFDCSILEAAYEAVDRPAPWEYYQLRDVRTVRKLPGAPDIELAADESEHDALDDARAQARLVAQVVQEMGGEPA